MQKRYQLTGLAMSAAFTVALAAPAIAADSIKIGVDGPFTGPSARIGLDIQNGTKMAIEDARAALKEAEEKGTIPLLELMKELGD